VIKIRVIQSALLNILKTKQDNIKEECIERNRSQFIAWHFSLVLTPTSYRQSRLTNKRKPFFIDENNVLHGTLKTPAELMATFFITEDFLLML